MGNLARGWSQGGVRLPPHALGAVVQMCSGRGRSCHPTVSPRGPVLQRRPSSFVPKNNHKGADMNEPALTPVYEMQLLTHSLPLMWAELDRILENAS